MTDFLLRHLIKDYNNVTSEAVRQRYGALSGTVGIVVNALLCLVKILAGLFFQSVALIADGINNLSDAGSSIITLIGFKLSSRPADEEHPYGHERIEYITGLVVSFIVLLLGLQLIFSSVEKILHPEALQFHFITIVLLVLAIAAKLWLGLFYRQMGKKIQSPALLATSTDSFNDVFATGAVLLSTIIGKFTNLQLDGIAGLIVALFITYSGIGLIRDTVNPLLGMMPDPELVSSIREKIMSYEGVLGLHDLVVHNYGPSKCFASVHVEVPASQDILVSHDIIDNIEKDFGAQMHINLVIHLDPIVTDNEEINDLSHMVDAVLEGIDPVLSKHDFRVVFGKTHTNLIFDVTVPPKFRLSDKELSESIQAGVHARDKALYCVITLDRSYISTTKYEK